MQTTNPLRKLQQEFLGFILDDAASTIVGQMESTPRRSARERMALYGTAYTLRLKEALATDYERLHTYLGDDLFDKLMQQYIEAYPSRHPNLRYFSQHMVDLIERLDIFQQVPQVAEIARIEHAFANSFDAADCHCVTLEDLAQLEPAAWVTLTPVFHSAVQLLPQRYNSFQIWQALGNVDSEGTEATVTPPERTDDNTTWLIWRQNLISQYRALEAPELAALTLALSGGDFSDLCVALLDHFDEQETPPKAVAFLQQWINDQMICELRLGASQ
ncbi:MAG: DNA-binding domain-containing protein [Burkholderiaceae bacterium]